MSKNREKDYEKGRQYYLGEGEKQSYFKAAKYFEKALEKENHLLAHCLLEGMYSFDQGGITDRDRQFPSLELREASPEELRELRKRAEEGDKLAPLGLGIYKTHHGPEEEAIFWYKKAASKGLSQAMCALAWLFVHPESGDPQYQQALRWARQATWQKESNAALCLSWIWEDGLGVETSKEKAMYWLEKAAEWGDGYARNLLAEGKINKEKQ